MRGIIACLFVFSSIGSLSAADDLDSLARREGAHSVIFRLINQSNELINTDPTAAFDKVQSALEMSFKYDNKRGEGYCYNTMGALSYRLANYQTAVNYYLNAVKIFEEITEPQGLYNSLKYIGSAYDGANNWDKALEYYLVFIEKARETGNVEDVNFTESNIARVYYNMGKFSLAKERYLRVLEVEKAKNNPTELAKCYENLGLVYVHLKDTATAVSYFELANSTAAAQGDVVALNSSSNSLIDVYSKDKSSKRKLEYQNRALEQNEKFGNRKGELDYNIDIGNTLLADKNITEAIPYLQRSIDLSTELGQLEEKSLAYQALSEAYVQMGDYSKALENYQRFMAVADSLGIEKNREAQTAFKLSLELQQKEKNIELITKEKEIKEKRISLLEQEQQLNEENIKRQRQLMYGLIAGIFIVVLGFLLFLRSQSIKRKADRLLALRSLRGQMNPHFIFNSLNSINSFISKQDERSANKYLSDFSKLMRMVLENSRHDFVPLSKELEVLNIYLELEHFRFSDKFDYEFNVAPDIEQEDIEIPPMLIQPYIENAIWHGLRYREEKGFLKVSISKNGTGLKCLVEDNGIGRNRSEELKTKNQRQNTSLGMKNIEKRLEIINHLHKTNIRVSISNLNGDINHPGTKVEISIPVKIHEHDTVGNH